MIEAQLLRSGQIGSPDILEARPSSLKTFAPPPDQLSVTFLSAIGLGSQIRYKREADEPCLKSRICPLRATIVSFNENETRFARRPMLDGGVRCCRRVPVSFNQGQSIA
jgi:hypothetical protein